MISDFKQLENLFKEIDEHLIIEIPIMKEVNKFREEYFEQLERHFSDKIWTKTLNHCKDITTSSDERTLTESLDDDEDLEYWKK